MRGGKSSVKEKIQGKDQKKRGVEPRKVQSGLSRQSGGESPDRAVTSSAILEKAEETKKGRMGSGKGSEGKKKKSIRAASITGRKTSPIRKIKPAAGTESTSGKRGKTKRKKVI